MLLLLYIHFYQHIGLPANEPEEIEFFISYFNDERGRSDDMAYVI